MEGIQSMFERQSFLTKEIERVHTNFRKDSSSRKTPEYLHSRLAALDKCWKEFEENHIKLLEFEDDQYEYFSKQIYGYMKDYYIKTKEMMSSYKEPKFPTFSLPTFEEYSYQGDDLLGQQDTNIRALERLMNRISVEDLEEKWELQDELKNLQHLWKVIDTTHLRLDNQLKGSNDEYETRFLQIEERYLTIKRELNRKLNSTAHLEQATPKLEVPTFFGKYTQWPTFFDLFVEAIHNNKSISKAQKMQHLKGKVKGEAEGLIQHLHISAENYETAWDILTHRYNNPQILFTTQMDIFLNQPPITKQSSYHAFKKLHDTTTQCINSIRNLGIDIATWDPILVHLLSKKLDDETRTDYMESRVSPRDLTSYTDFLHFLENKFMAREPVGKKEKPATSDSYKSSSSHPKPYNHNNSSGNASHYKKYQSNATNNKRFCPVCKQPHNLYQCKQFLAQSPDAKMRTISQHNICRNCLYKHYDKMCISTKRCKECNGDHNSIMHDALSTMRGDPLEQTNKPRTQHFASSSDSASTSRNSHNVNYVASDNEEVLLTTVALIIRAADGSNMRFRALLDQGSQVSLISENAAQLLGLKRQSYQAAVSGIGSTQKQSRGLVSLDCISIYYDYHFSTEALVVSRVINNLPNNSFRNQAWPHLSHTRLADPEYNISKPIDLLLDASVYSAIIMSGLIKGPIQAPIAQQTKLGWILSGNVKTFACQVCESADALSKQISQDKCPVNKLTPLPVQENSTMRTHSLDGTQGTSHGHRNRSKFSMKTLLTSALLLLMMIISPSIQQSTTSYNITSLDSQRNMLFDKVSELQQIKDEWKLIVYYNMSTYWSGFTALETYVRHLNQLCQRTCLPQSGVPYGAIILQLQHELNELQHYNSLLRNPNKRYKRGLVNGVGNLASYLFGVLDDKFAEQYKRDIEQISLNENHLQSLIKNQTLIVESEYSIIRRNEAIMNQQFTSMDKQMKTLLKEVNIVQSDTTRGLYLTSSALSAYGVLSTLRRMQQGLIDVITDIYHGRIDTHLLPPEELEAQINIITREVQDDLNVPLDKSSFRSLYKLLRVFAQVYNDYLIMEIKIPLITTEKYELDKVIPLQREESGQNYQVISTYPYLAFNLRKDLVLFFTENDLQQCLHANPEKILCSIDKPIYEIREKQSICDVKINDIITPACIYKQSRCENKWVKLRRPNDWLYQCCQQCTIRIFSTRSTEVKTLSGNGIISLCPGCTLKGESFKIYSHKNFINHVDYYTEEMQLPQMSVVNEIVNTSIPSVKPFVPEDHHTMWNQLRSEIDDLKQQSTQTITVHDVHQYSVLYLLVGGAILTGFILVVVWIRRRRRQQPTLESKLELAGLQTITNPQPTPRKITESTSTPNLQSIKFDIPLCES